MAPISSVGRVCFRRADKARATKEGVEMINLRRIVSIVHMLAFAVVLCPLTVAETRKSASVESLLQQNFDLASQRSPQTQYYQIENKIVAYRPRWMDSSELIVFPNVLLHFSQYILALSLPPKAWGITCSSVSLRTLLHAKQLWRPVSISVLAQSLMKNLPNVTTDT